VRDALAASRGGTDAEVGKAVRDALDPASPAWRAHVERTARTTATAAVGEGIAVGTAELAQQTGQRLGLRWRSERDAQTRPSHRDADGQVVAIGQRFAVGMSSLRWPGDPLGPPDEVVNCRCVVVPTTDVT
jgi:uncharacterized protein with gpF-like domain